MLSKIKAVRDRVNSNEGTLFTYAFAYSIIVGLAPLLIISVVFVSNYVFSIEQIVNLLSKYIPGDLINPFVSYLAVSDISSLNLIIPLLGASIWVASKSIYSFLLLSSEGEGYKISHIFLRILSVVYFVAFVIGLVAVGFLVSFIPFQISLFLPIILFVFFLFFYRILSFNRISFKQLIWGSLFTSIALSLVGQLFFVYINSFSNYESIYGPLSSFMILLISSWMISWIIFVGYCINVIFGKTQDNEPIKFFGRFNRS